MKKRKLIGLASLMLALGAMAGCKKPVDNTGTDDNHTVEPGACEHDYQWVKVDDKKHMEKCTKCGDEKAAKNHSWKKDPAKVADNQEATCTDAGWEWQICDICGATKKKDIDAKGHSFTVVKSTTATCTEAGENTMKCSRCDVESPEKQPAEKLGHDMVADESYTEGLPASCTGQGTAREKCTRCTYTEIVDTPALGHDYNETKATEVDGFATLTTGICKRTACEGRKVYWSALEVTDNCKNNKRLAREAVAADPDNGVEAQEAFYEPNYVEEDDGVRFWGRPIHNACVLQENGKPESQSAATPVYDETVTGSFFEYKINLAEAMTGVKLVADMAVTRDLGSGELYKATSSDWTPGLHDSTSNKYAVRYAIFVTTGDNTVEIALDAEGSYPCPGTDRQWYTFPSAALDLAAGEHTIRIAMAGGYLSTYYAFGFEKEIGAIHTHEYVKNTELSSDPTCTEDGRFYGVCSCGKVDDRVLTKLGHDLQDADSENNKAATCGNAGLQHKACSRCEYVEDVPVAALGHDFVADGEPMVNEGFATINPQKCSRDEVYRYVIDAKDVSDATKNDKRLVSAAVEADPDNGVEAQEAVYEPNYTENNDGSVKFYGRPIHNAMNLPATNNDHTSVYDENVVGSFIEYKFKVPTAIEDVKLVAEIKPANYMRNNRVPMFSNPESLDSDWTPGLSADGVGYPTRYIVTLNGNVLEQDLTNDKVAESDDKAWFAFPLKDQLDFAAGDYTLRITMAGGYECSFYNIGIQTQDVEPTEIPPEPPVHEHAYVAGDKAADSDLRVVACTCGDTLGYELQAADCTGETAPNANTAGTRLGKNNKDDVWEINGLPAGAYEVYLNGQTQSGNQNNYWNAGDDVAHNNNSGQNGGASAGDIAYRYNIAAGADADSYRTAVDVGVADTTYTDSGIDNTAPKWTNVPVAVIVVEDGDTVLKLHGNNNGYAIFVFGLRLVKHEHTWVATEMEAADGAMAYTDEVCACGAHRMALNALGGEWVGSSKNKTGNGAPPAGWLKLASNGHSIAYKFNAPAAGKAHLVIEACMDSFGTAGSGNTVKTFYSGSNPYEEKENPNIEFTLGEGEGASTVDLSGFKTTQYGSIFPTEEPVASGFSGIAMIDLGEIDLVANLNTLTIKRIDSFNVLIRNIYIVF